MERGHKFDPAMIDRLADAERVSELAPERILEAAGLDTASVHTAVDLGAGPGIIARGLARLLPEATFYALDVAPELVAYLEEHLSESERERIVPRVTEEATIDLDDDAVDFLLMVDVYHELHDAPRLLAEARRVLRQGGTILVVDWAQGASGGGPPDHHRVPVDVLEEEMAKAGFAQVRRSDLFSRHHAVRALAP